MTKFFTIFSILVLLTHSLFAQTPAVRDSSWKRGGLGAINFNQVSFTNWAGGGQNSMSGAAYLSVFANYAKDKTSWDNLLNLAYGLTKIGDAKVQKNEDKIDFNSKYGYKAGQSKFYYTFLFNFKSQFANGFTTPEDSVPISKFGSPAYLLYSLGMDYKPNDNFSLYFSPITGKTLLVMDQTIADAGIYGNDPLTVDANGNITHGKKTLTQVGAYLRAAYKKDVMTNVNLQTKLELFSNYLKNPENIAINWEVLLAMKINKYLTANLGTQMIYDDIIKVPITKQVNGVTTTETGKRVQIKEVFGIGLSYKF